MMRRTVELLHYLEAFRQDPRPQVVGVDPQEEFERLAEIAREQPVADRVDPHGREAGHHEGAQDLHGAGEADDQKGGAAQRHQE
jgi:hypothetical protein